MVWESRLGGPNAPPGRAVLEMMMSRNEHEYLARLDAKEDTIERMGQRIARLAKERNDLLEASKTVYAWCNKNSIYPIGFDAMRAAIRRINTEKETG